MLKSFTIAAALVCGLATAVCAKPLTPPGPPQTRYELPGAAVDYPADRLGEGRSIYQMEVPDTFWRGVDERGYPTGLQENPQSGH